MPTIFLKNDGKDHRTVGRMVYHVYVDISLSYVLCLHLEWEESQTGGDDAQNSNDGHNDSIEPWKYLKTALG
jgi:hypothetical protein